MNIKISFLWLRIIKEETLASVPLKHSIIFPSFCLYINMRQ